MEWREELSCEMGYLVTKSSGRRLRILKCVTMEACGAYSLCMSEKCLVYGPRNRYLIIVDYVINLMDTDPLNSPLPS